MQSIASLHTVTIASYIAIHLCIHLHTCAVCLLSLARAGQLFPNGFTTRLPKGVNPLPLVDVEETLTDLRLESSVRVPVHVVSVTMLALDFFMTTVPLFTDQCTFQRDPGPCREFISYSHFYNVTSHTCERLIIYGGCGGNDNRLSSEDDCMAQCVSGEWFIRSIHTCAYLSSLKLCLFDL